MAYRVSIDPLSGLSPDPGLSSSGLPRPARTLLTNRRDGGRIAPARVGAPPVRGKGFGPPFTGSTTRRSTLLPAWIQRTSGMWRKVCPIRSPAARSTPSRRTPSAGSPQIACRRCRRAGTPRPRVAPCTRRPDAARRAARARARAGLRGLDGTEACAGTRRRRQRCHAGPVRGHGAGSARGLPHRHARGHGASLPATRGIAARGRACAATSSSISASGRRRRTATSRSRWTTRAISSRASAASRAGTRCGLRSRSCLAACRTLRPCCRPRARGCAKRSRDDDDNRARSLGRAARSATTSCATSRGCGGSSASTWRARRSPTPASAHLRGCDALREVNLSWTRTGDGALRALAGKPHLAQLPERRRRHRRRHRAAARLAGVQDLAGRRRSGSSCSATTPRRTPVAARARSPIAASTTCAASMASSRSTSTTRALAITAAVSRAAARSAAPRAPGRRRQGRVDAGARRAAAPALPRHPGHHGQRRRLGARWRSRRRSSRSGVAAATASATRGFRRAVADAGAARALGELPERRRRRRSRRCPSSLRCES